MTASEAESAGTGSRRMTVLLLGGSGQVGRALLAAAPAGTRIEAPSHAALDIRDARALAEAIAAVAPNIVFNAAAYTQVDRAETETDEANAVNVEAAGAAAAAAHAAGAAFVHLSTDYVFDGAANTPYAPGATPNPLNVYGRTKRAGEVEVMRKHPGAIIVRTSWIYAADGRNFLRAVLARMIKGESLRVVDDQTGTPTAAFSLAAALWTLARARAPGLFHYCDSGTATWHEFAVAIQEEALAAGLLSRPVTITPIASADYPSAARRPRYSLLDARGAWAITGIPPHWRTQLRATLGAMRNPAAGQD